MNRYFYRKCCPLIVAIGVVAGAMTVGTITSASGQIPSGGSNANVSGVFGPVVSWPIIPLEAVLLPDGRVMSYGTDQSGNQGGQLVYDVWNPASGTGTNAHMVLSNTTPTDIFCSGPAVMTNGNVLITGGDLTVDGQRNFANNNTTIFMPTTNTITEGTPMNYPRWYPSLVSQPDGQLVVFGGYQNQTPPLNDPVIPATTPEVYDPATQIWTPLTGATSDAAFGGDVNWYYPRSYVAPGGNIGGNIFVLGADGTMYSMTTAGAGSITQLATTAPYGSDILPTIPFAPGKLLSVRSNQVYVVDFTGSTPVVTQTANLDQYRYYASGTVMADGTVLVNGGSTVPNQLTGVAYQVEIWNPATGLWTAGASAAEPRLYHSNALLLTDATVLTGGGGAPGPLTNLNAEIYYPPYLYASSGQPAVRPVITSATPQNLLPGNTINITVGSTGSAGSPTYVQGNYAVPQTSQATVNVAYNTAQAAGDLNVVIVGWNDTTAQVSSVSDTKGNSYQLAVGPTQLSGIASQSIYYAKNIAGAAAGANAVTVTFTKAAAYPDIRVLEYSGIDTSTPLDVSVGATGTGGTSSSGAVTTTNAADLLVGANTVQDYTTGPGSNFTKRIVTSPNGDIAEDRVVAATGSYSASASVAGNFGWVAQMVAFRAAATQPAQISKLTFVRTGSATHDNNMEQRFINLSFQQTGQQLTTVLPSDPTVLVPGYYMLFAFNSAGVPSTAQVLSVGASGTPPPPPSEYVVQNGYSCPQGVVNNPAVTLNETAGDMNVVVIGWNDNSTTINSVTDSQGNAYTLAVPVVRYPASGSSTVPVSQAMYSTPHVKAGANTVKVTFAGSVPYPDLRVLELHGVDAPDVSASAGGSGIATSSGSIHPTTPGLIISAVTTSDGVNSVAGGWNLVVETRPDSDSVATYAGASSPGGTAFSDGATLGGGSGGWVSQMLNTNDTAP